MRCLYLTTAVRSSTEWVIAPSFRERLLARSETSDTCWMVVDDIPAAPVPPPLRGELRAARQIRALAPDVIVVERRLWEGDTPRIPWPLLDELVHAGAQLLLLGFTDPDQYGKDQHSFIGASPQMAGSTYYSIVARDPADGVKGDLRFIAASRREMAFFVDPRLDPVYARAPSIGCRGGIVISAHQSVLAMAGSSAAALSSADRWAPDVDLLVFASLRTWGAGHVVVVAGDLLSDDVIAEFPGNLDFADDLLTHLTEQSVQRGFTTPVDRSPTPLPGAGDFTLDARVMAVLGDRGALVRARLREALRCARADAPTAAVVFMGSALEGALHACVRADPGAANSAARAPKRDGKVRAFKDWKFGDLLEVAADLGWIADHDRRIGAVLRDYRNFVHVDVAEGHAAIDGDLVPVYWDLTSRALQRIGERVPAPPTPPPGDPRRESPGARNVGET